MFHKPWYCSMFHHPSLTPNVIATFCRPFFQPFGFLSNDSNHWPMKSDLGDDDIPPADSCRPGTSPSSCLWILWKLCRWGSLGNKAMPLGPAMSNRERQFRVTWFLLGVFFDWINRLPLGGPTLWDDFFTYGTFTFWGVCTRVTLQFQTRTSNT